MSQRLGSFDSWGNRLRGVCDLLAIVTDETKLTLHGDGRITTRVIDRGNTLMIDAEWRPTNATLPRETPIAINTAYLRQRARFARKGRGKSPGDHITVELNDDHTTLTIDRDGVTRRAVVPGIDPNAVIDPPEMVNDEFRGPHRATLDYADLLPLRDYLDELRQDNAPSGSRSNHLWIAPADGETVRIGAEFDHGHDDHLEFDADGIDDNDPDTVTWLSTSLVYDAVRVLRSIKTDRATFVFGDELPMWIEFEVPAPDNEPLNNDGPWLTGQIVIAPRVRSDSKLSV
jgi:hypothetical protein